MTNLLSGQHKTRENSGFTLVEMSVVILIMGLIIGSVFAVINPLNKNMREAETGEKMEYIADAIANYAAKNNRIPCPAPPNPDDNTGTANQISGIMYTDSAGNPDCGAGNKRFGIVPFRTLGIHPDMIVDGWGNHFTYAVSPVFAMKPTSDDVHSNCRDSKWMDDGSPKKNRAPEKARFCCPDISPYNQNADIVIEDENGVAIFEKRRTGGGHYADVDTEGTYESTHNVTSAAFVLISHGINGYGHYPVNSANPADRFISVDAGDSEEENVDDSDIDFITSPRVLVKGSEYYDDIILWRSQDAVRYEFGNDSCALP